MADYLSLLHRMPDDDAVEYIKTNFEAADSRKSDDIKRNERYDLVYRALDPEELRITKESDKPEENEDIWANSYLPVAAARVDSHTSYLFNTIFSTPDYLAMDADNNQDDLAAAKIGAHLLRTHRDSGFKSVVYDTLLAMDCFDYVVTLTSWRLEAGFVPRRREFIDTIDLAGFKAAKRRIDLEFEWVPDAIDRPETYVIDYFDCCHDWKAKGRGRSGFEDSRFFFDQRQEPFWKLKEAAISDEHPLGKYKNVDQIRKVLEDDAKKQFPKATEDDINDLVEEGLVTITRCFTKFETVEIAFDYVIRRQKTFDWPTTLWRCFRIPGKFAGMGLVQRVERMQYDINSDLNSRRNFWNMVTDPATFMHDDLVTKLQGGEFRHGQTYTWDSDAPISDLFLMAQPAVGAPPDPMGQLATEIAIMDDVMKVSLPMQGRFAPGRRTAAEARSVAAGGDIHYIAGSDLIEEGPLTRTYEMEFRLNQQFMTRQARLKHHGKFGVYAFQITPADYKLTGGARFMALGTRNKDDAIKNQQFFQGMQYALLYPQYNNIRNIFESMWKRLTPGEYKDFLADETQGAENIPPMLEDQIMAMGHEVEVSPANDHQFHAAVHRRYERSRDFELLPNDRKQFHQDHIAQHQQAMQQQAVQMIGARDLFQREGAFGQGRGEEAISQGMSGPSFGALG